MLDIPLAPLHITGLGRRPDDAAAEQPSARATPPRPVVRIVGSATSLSTRQGLITHWARHEHDVRDAQRLRHAVFVAEMGARLPCATPGLDIDVFDPYCEHLLVRRAASDGQPGEVIGTYRLLTPGNARRIHPERGLYSDTEFDLTRLRHLRDGMVELGRSCVHRDHRHGGAILALWRALEDFMSRNRLHTMVGCASVSMSDGGHAAARLWRQLSQTHLADVEHRVTPRLPLPVQALDDGLPAEPPALIKGYLRLGARLLGPPAWDPEFNTADFPLMMRMADLPTRYRRHFETTGALGAHLPWQAITAKAS